MKPLVSTPRLTWLRLLFLLLIAVGLGTGVGYLTFKGKSIQQLTLNVRHRVGLTKASPEIPGQWGLYEAPREDPQLQAEQLAEMKRLQSLGYAGGTVSGRAGQVISKFDPQAASKGLRLFTSGHEPGAYLMDTEGRIHHTWRLSYRDCVRQNKDPDLVFLPDNRGVTNCWRRVHLFENGDLLAVYEGHGLVRIDRDSHLIWSFPGACHHDLEVGPDGSIYVLTRETELVPEINPRKPLLTDFITHLSPAGKPLGTIDILAAFQNSVFAPCLNDMADLGDILHNNTLEILDGRSAHLGSAFAMGNFLISVRELDLVAVIDSHTEKVVWAMGGMWSAQHQPTLLENGNILLFDNLGNGGRSKVVEINPLTQEVAWTYADGPATPLFSETCGSCQRLPNGNTLITESNNGRALEVSPDGTTVWEFRNPQRTGKKRELIAAIMEMVVLPDEFHPAWMTHPQ